MATPVNLRFAIPDEDVLMTPSASQQYQLGEVLRTVDETNKQERVYIYLQATGSIAANSIAYLAINNKAAGLPASGGEVNIVPLGTDYAVADTEYAWFVTRGTFTGTADASGLAEGTDVEWIKSTTTLKEVLGVRTATTVGFAQETIGGGQTGKIYLYGFGGASVAT